MKHTILGAGGSIGNALTHELLSRGEEVRLVSRSKYTIKGTEVVKGDLTDLSDTVGNVKGSDVAYLLVGLQYKTKVWEELWPKIMKNTIEACKKENVKLIFFDNVYMYGKVEGIMTETTPYNPCSKKGEIRAKIAELLESEMKKGNINAIIARAADLYGPHATVTSIPFIMVFDKLINGKKAQGLVTLEKKHSYTYTIDCAKGLNMLANDENASNQVWHMPTYYPPISSKEFIEIAYKELGKEPQFIVLKKWMIKLAGIFDKTISEMYEMLYQNEYDYYFDSSKFNTHFNYQPYTYRNGIRETLEFIMSNKNRPEG